MKKEIIKIENLSRVFGDGKNQFYALDNVSFDIYEDETLGIVGESGSGKSTIAKILTRLLEKSDGKIFFEEKEVSELKEKDFVEIRKNIQMIMQNSSDVFNPRMTIEEIVCEPMINFKLLNKNSIRKKAVELLDMVGLDESFCERYPNEVSGGQLQRIATARAFSIHPKIIICDEACSALDVSVQKKIIDLLIELREKHNMQYIFISHDIALVENFCDSVIVMYHGNIFEIIRGKSIVENAKHPYTKLLISSYLPVDCSLCFEELLKNTVDESATRVSEGCAFQNRCPHVMDICKKEKPELKDCGSGQKLACHLFEKKAKI